MAISMVEKHIELILERLMDDNVKRVILVGEPGVGKTWMARELSERAIERGLFDYILWLSLKRDYDRTSLCRSVAQQLYLLCTAEECEDDDYEEEEDEEGMELDLHRKINALLAGKRLLLILDGEGEILIEEVIMLKLTTLLDIHQLSWNKVLITTAFTIDNNISEDSMRSVILAEPLTEEESFSLLRERAGSNVFKIPGIEPLIDECVQRSMGLAAEIVVIAKALSYVGQCDYGLKKLEIALEKVAYGESFGIALLLRCWYDRLTTGVPIDCCWHDHHFFPDVGRIHYNELIAYWIMEGYLGQVDCIGKTYEEGYHVLMKLMDICMLKTEETDCVVMKRATINLDDRNSFGFSGTARLGLANLFRYSKWEGLGRLTLMDGIITSLYSDKKIGKPSTLLLDGDRVGREISNNLLHSKQDLKVLAVFNPIFESLPQSLSNMDELNVLVLRSCHFLGKVDMLEVRKLTVLEISGPSPLITMADDFFRHMPLLQSANFSALQIEALPSSLFDLSELRWLILRGCSHLRGLPSLRRMRNLEVLDLSGATSLDSLSDKSFHSNVKLQIINLSRTKIRNIPLLSMIENLTHILLSGCQAVERLPSIRRNTALQIVDLSDTSRFVEFRDETLESNVDLKILDLSGTAVVNLPSNISNLHHLYLKGCTRIETLNLEEEPHLNSLRKLEVLDLSGCTSLKVIQGKSFEMNRLQRLDLSETKIDSLPSLANLCNLRHLLLKRCPHLRVIPPLESLTKLEELNLSGISSLRKTGVNFLEHMSRLQILDLSETLLERLPSFSNLNNLHELYLRGCLGLKTVPDLEALTNLEVLDLSGTAFSHLPSLENFSNLRQLLLRDCSGLEAFLEVEILDLLGGTVGVLPYGISELTHLERLDLPNMNTIQGADGRKLKHLQEELNWCDWGISTLSAEIVGGSERPPILVSSTQFLQLLDKNPSLWKTSFKQFHFSVFPIEEQARKGIVSFYKDDFIFRDVYFKTRQLSDFQKQRSLEIRGFHHPPKGLEDVSSHANSVFFIDNTFKRWLSDLGASKLKLLKGCWIERCREMECVFHEEEMKELDQLGGLELEVLWVSNSVNLKCIYLGNWQSHTFQNLKRLYLDCCPNMSIVFSSSQPPVNLQILQIKFCDELKAVFEEASPEAELPMLDTLYLWELPELKSIGCALPSLQNLKVWGCPNLGEFEENVKLTRCL